jgi:hypothetical protein
MLGLAEAGQVRVNDGGDRAFVAEVDLDLAEVLALLQQVGRIRMAQGVDVRLLFDAAGLEGEAEGPLQRGTAHRFGGAAGAQPTVPLGGKEQDRMAMRFPLLAQEQQRAPGQRDIAVLIAFAGADVNEHPLGINVADLQAQPFAQAQAAGVNGDQADAMIQGGNGSQNAAHLGPGEHDREFELGIGAGQFQFVRPGALERLFPEQFDGADGLGAGLARDLLVGLEMDAVLPNVFGAEQVGGLGVELAELADTSVIGLFGARADGQELEVVSEGF